MKELIVHENDQVMSIGYGLDAASGVQDDALRTLELLISEYTSAEVCSEYRLP